jgi:hypothetical protein
MSTRIKQNDDVYHTAWWVESPIMDFEQGTFKFETGWYIVRSLGHDGKTAICELVSPDGENEMCYKVSELFTNKTEAMAHAMSQASKSKYNAVIDSEELKIYKELHPERFV